ncbi:MAG: twin-arginine translocase TatA/TatE family subunit [Thermodesulfobacteriota bacterium]|nr:twin-arginine translocase TatA/TatE family subunit [Thermodesulfobacteriota bacterium]
MFGLGTTELIVIGVIIFLIFGAKRLPDIGKGLGGALREFRNIKKDLGVREETHNKEKNQEQKNQQGLDDKSNEKVLDKVQGVKKAMDAKSKVEKLKKIID